MARISMTTRGQRVLSILAVGVAFLLLQTWAGIVVSTQVKASTSATLWILYTCYALISLLFYCIGSFCWLYAYGKQHAVATLLFAFTSIMMVAFSTLSASSTNDYFTTCSSVSTAFAILCLFFLLLKFPYPIFGSLRGPTRTIFRVCLVLMSTLCAFTVFRNIAVFLFHVTAPNWWIVVCLVYYLFVAIAIIFVVVCAARRVQSVREQQQSRFFFLGTLLSFVPILGLTVIPTLLHARLVVDGSLSMIFLVLFPLTLSYAILRYNVMVFDSYVKRVVTVIIGVVGLALLTFVLFAIGNVLAANTISFSLAGMLCVGVIGAPCIWWGSRLVTEHVFFPESQYYKHVLKQIQHNQAEQSFDMQQVAHLLVIDVMTTLNAPGACVFLLDEKAHTYDLLLPPVQEAERTERVRTLLLAEVAQCLSASGQEEGQVAQTTALAQQLHMTRRPLFLSEVTQVCEDVPSDRGGRYLPFVKQQEERSGPLLAPLRSPQGAMIGFVLVSERGDEQRYGGPDLEALVQLLHISAPQVETARQFHITMQEKERTAQEREEAYEQQRNLAEMKDRLIIHMSHELRTPLAEVSGFISLLLEYGDALDSEHRATFLKKADHGCEELLTLLQQILDSSQSDTSTKKLKMEQVRLTSLLTEEAEHLDPTQAQHHTFAFGLEEALSAWADEQSLRQIVRNLLSNALKYSPGHTLITIGAKRQEESVLLSVHNEGDGISSEEMPLLFEKFVRLERHHSGAIRGTGLGLYICRQLAEAMGGTIWAESSGREGEGTTFYVRLKHFSSVEEAGLVA